MTLKLERATTWTQKRLKLGMVSSFDPITCVQKLRGLRQKLDALCVQLDHLFQSTRVSHENSSVTKTFYFSKLISTQDFVCIQHATFKSTYCNFNPFWLHLIFFMHLIIYFQLNDLEIGKGYNLNSEKVETWAWYHHLTHITCAQKLRGLRQKLDALRVQTGPSLSKYKGFRRKVICYKDISFF